MKLLVGQSLDGVYHISVHDTLDKAELVMRSIIGAMDGFLQGMVTWDIYELERGNGSSYPNYDTSRFYAPDGTYKGGE